MRKSVTTLLLVPLLSLLLVGEAAEAKPKKPPKLTPRLLEIGIDGAAAAVARGLGVEYPEFATDYYYEITECQQTKSRNTARGCDGIAFQYVGNVLDYDPANDQLWRRCDFEVTVSTKRIRGGTNPIFTFINSSGYGGSIDFGQKVIKVYTQRSTDLTCGAPGPFIPPY
jgi:hypothetical protein